MSARSAQVGHLGDVRGDGPGDVHRGHTWRLRDVEFEDGVTTRCFECASCGAVHYD